MTYDGGLLFIGLAIIMTESEPPLFTNCREEFFSETRFRNELLTEDERMLLLDRIKRTLSATCQARSPMMRLAFAGPSLVLRSYACWWRTMM